MAESWVRLWSGMTTDPKWQTVARKSGQPRSLVIALFTHLMLEANDADERGSLADVDVEDVASALDCDEEAVVAILEAMEGRVIEDGFLSGWDRRQPVREDSGNPQTGALSSTERSRLHREKKRLETQCNARNDDATRCNAPEAEADTEADIPPTPPARDGDFRMDLDWQPSEHFPTLARQAGIPADQITPEVVAEFRSYWIGQGKAMTQHQWDHKLLTNLKATKTRGALANGARASPSSSRQPKTLSEGRAAAAKAIFNPGPAGNDHGHERRTIDVTPPLADGLGAKALR
jgi:hypothetical protein